MSQAAFSSPALVEAITTRAREFTLAALLDALSALGLLMQEIEFRSHSTREHQSALVHSVEFSSSPRRVVVRLNIGLLAAQSPLPSYLLALLDDGKHDSDALTAFLGLLDHPLLRERAHSEYPERDRRCWSDWESSKTILLSLMALQSPSSLHWLFQRIYPELAVNVERHLQDQTLITDQVILGATELGASRALGGEVKLAAGSLSVTLYSEEADSAAGRPWAREAWRRLHHFVLPLLQEKNMFLDVWLVFFDRDTTAHLIADRRLPDSFLGYDPLGIPVSARTDADRPDTDPRGVDRGLQKPSSSMAIDHLRPSTIRLHSEAMTHSERSHSCQRVLLFRGHTDRI